MNDTLTTARRLAATLDTNRVCDRCPGRDFCLDQPESWCYDAARSREDDTLDDYAEYWRTQLVERRYHV